METLLSLYKLFLAFSKELPFVAGFLTVWLTGIITFLCRNIPKQIYTFSKARLTSQLTLTNSGWGENELNFHSFLSWFLKQPLAGWSRTYALERMYLSGLGNTDIVGAGSGTHHFMFKGRLFWFTREKITGNTGDKIKEEVCITGLTRSKSLILELINEFKYKANENALFAYKWEGKEYGSRVRLMERNPCTVVLSGDNMSRLMAEIQDFIDNEKWYKDRGIPYKLVIMLLGPPGTGKTSCARALATHFRRNVYQININSLSDTTAFKAFAEPNKKSIILVEELDDNDAVKARSGIETAIAKQTGKTLVETSNDDVTPSVSKISEPQAGLTLTSLLNALDGIVPLDDAVVIMTSNDISKIDPALLRSGRIDSYYTLEYLSDVEIREYIRVMTGYTFNRNIATVNFKPISGSDLYDIFRRNKHSISDFIQAIPKEIHTPIPVKR